MKKLTIIKETEEVYIDGVMIGGIDLSSLPDDLHAVQWDNDSGHGEIEYTAKRCSCCGSISKKPNQPITNAHDYAQIIEAHGVRLVEIKAEEDRKSLTEAVE